MAGSSATRAAATAWKWEVIKDLKNRRVALAIGTFMLLPVLAAPMAVQYAQSYDPLDVLLFPHLVRDGMELNRPLLVLYTLSAWGDPVGDYPITILESAQSLPIELRTDGGGRLAYPLDPNVSYQVVFKYRQYTDGAQIGPEDMQLPGGTYDLRLMGQRDLDFDRRAESQLIHAVFTAGGRPATDLRVWVNGALQGSVDSHGYFRAILPEGNSEVVVGNGTATLLDLFTGSFSGTGAAAMGRRQGPSAVLAFLWETIVVYLVPLFCVASAVDAASTERLHGTIDLLRTRPISRLALGVGRIAGSVTLIFLGCAFGTGMAALAASLAYGEIMPIGPTLGFLLGQWLFGVAFFLLASVLSAVVRGVTESYVAAVAAWLLLGPAWLMIVAALGGSAEHLSPYELSTKVVALTMPSPVVYSWDVFSAVGSSTQVILGLAAWYVSLSVLMVLWWYAPQFQSLWRGRPRGLRGRPLDKRTGRQEK